MIRMKEHGNSYFPHVAAPQIVFTALPKFAVSVISFTLGRIAYSRQLWHFFFDLVRTYGNKYSVVVREFRLYLRWGGSSHLGFIRIEGWLQGQEKAKRCIG